MVLLLGSEDAHNTIFDGDAVRGGAAPLFSLWYRYGRDAVDASPCGM